MKLKEVHQIAKIRLEKAGRCETCAYLKGGGYKPWDTPECTHNLLDKIPEGNVPWGEKGCPCPFWTPQQVDLCEKHGLFFENAGCTSCEAEYYAKMA